MGGEEWLVRADSSACPPKPRFGHNDKQRTRAEMRGRSRELMAGDMNVKLRSHSLMIACFWLLPLSAAAQVHAQARLEHDTFDELGAVMYRASLLHTGMTDCLIKDSNQDDTTDSPWCSCGPS
jgi:hypothetical protein